jgi:hypothetical protein
MAYAVESKMLWPKETDTQKAVKVNRYWSADFSGSSEPFFLTVQAMK